MKQIEMFGWKNYIYEFKLNQSYGKNLKKSNFLLID